MTVNVGRAPFLTLWASVVARRLGYREDEAYTLGKAIAGQTAAAKAKRLGLAGEPSAAERSTTREKRAEAGAVFVPLMGKSIACVETPNGLRAFSSGAKFVDPDSVRSYLAKAFGEALADVEQRLEALAATVGPEDLNQRAMNLYMAMRPSTPAGIDGWGKLGVLDLAAIDRLRADAAPGSDRG